MSVIRWIWLTLLVISCLLVAVTGCSSAPAPPPSASSTPPQTTPAGPAVTVDLTAQFIKFDKSTVTVPAGATVTVNFTNKDSGIPHNFAVYQNLPGGQVKAIFVGPTITGPANTTYKFTAPPAPGSYFFECDVHPQDMNGAFVVQ